jgi:hypothetical protein
VRVLQPHHLGDPLVTDHVGQAVAAEHEPVAGAGGDLEHVDVGELGLR